MKKVFYIFIAIITFILGITASYFQPMAVRTVSLCEARSFDKKEVYVRAYLHVRSEDENDYFDSISSSEVGCVESAELVYSEKLNKDVKLKQFHRDLIEANKELFQNHFEKGWYLAEVEIRGEVDDFSNVGGITHCFPPYWRIKVKEIKQISPIHFISRESLK